ncbi:MAG TPA: glycine cleavage T C-terminal barrel domain-containing protein [Pyrinomonadaceae bacterium]|nr:glycine cleavage T C-terminal barrel domain-containing protein [Pyrinomonadaceae bacterium]
MINSDQLADYSLVRDGGAGLIDLSSRGRILVSGAEAVLFLNGLITNDMKSLAANAWMPAAFANVQGRLLAAVRIIHRQDGFLIDTESETRDAVIKLVERFTLAGDFKVTDLSTEMALLSVQGAKAADVVRSVLGEDTDHLQRHSAATAQFESVAVTVIRDTHTAEDGFDLFVEASAGAKLRDALTNAGATSVGEDTLETFRIEAGIARYGVDMDENNVVTETNLDDAVSFTKGCYIGQEIIVRIKHRGHVAKKLAGVVLDKATPAPRNSKIISNDEKEIGRVTSSTFSPRLNRAIALGYVKYDYLAPGTRIRVSSDVGSIDGEVSALPFVKGSWYEAP